MRSISQMAEADPSAFTSPRFAFSDLGAPGDFNVGFRFAVPCGGAVYIPFPALSRPCWVPRRPSRLSRVLRQTPPAYNCSDGIPSACSSRAPLGLTSCRLLALSTVLHRALASKVLRSEISCHAGVCDRTSFGA